MGDDPDRNEVVNDSVHVLLVLYLLVYVDVYVLEMRTFCYVSN